MVADSSVHEDRPLGLGNQTLEEHERRQIADDARSFIAFGDQAIDPQLEGAEDLELSRIEDLDQKLSDPDALSQLPDGGNRIAVAPVCNDDEQFQPAKVFLQ